MPTCCQFSSSRSTIISLHACEHVSYWKSFFSLNTVRFRIIRELKILRKAKVLLSKWIHLLLSLRSLNFKFPSINKCSIFLPRIFQRIYLNQGNKGSLIDQGCSTRQILRNFQFSFGVIDLTTIDIIIIGDKSSGCPVCALVFKSGQDLRQKERMKCAK